MLGLIELCLIFPLIPMSIAAAIVVLTGAWRMRQLESYRFCLAAAVVAMLPLHAGFLIGLPVGIWALTLLLDPEVKAAFRAQELQTSRKK